jgi:hypothetical protein
MEDIHQKIENRQRDSTNFLGILHLRVKSYAIKTSAECIVNQVFCKCVAYLTFLRCELHENQNT